MTQFDANTLRELSDLQEVFIRTEKHPKSAVVIWVAVDDNEIFVRSWLGAKGRWYKDLAAGGPATLEFAGRRLLVKAIPASDPDAVARTSREILRKYQRSSHAKEMARGNLADHDAARTALTGPGWIQPADCPAERRSEICQQRRSGGYS